MLRPMLWVNLAHSWSFGLGGDIIPLDDRPFSNMSLLKSPARMMWDVGWFVIRFWIWV